ncbi:hypothetical protein HF264_26720 [Rhizobium leguminosarum]|jgi:hypothetical protein|uniref:hypothetical protein n=1 Tax=Rhizobium leguminosarum TaxID=384 RepID=UPI001C929C6C|nr:hypothetical protein [Rhizobium leguminosarum]MBY2943248.1 hypothetical protein [Rhizobium leguminosarum]
MEDDGTPFVFDYPEDQWIAVTAVDLVTQKYERALQGGVKDFNRPEVQAEIVADSGASSHKVRPRERWKALLKSATSRKLWHRPSGSYSGSARTLSKSSFRAAFTHLHATIQTATSGLIPGRPWKQVFSQPKA